MAATHTPLINLSIQPIHQIPAQSQPSQPKAMLLRSIGRRGRRFPPRPAALIRHTLSTTSVEEQGRLVQWTQGEDGVAVVTLCNPSKLNVLTVSLSECHSVCSVLFA